MTSYDKQYQDNHNLFGVPYPKFEGFVREHALKGGKALDLGCGQGRDALMLAGYGYTVTAVDASKVGISQMLTRAQTRNLPINGVVADIFEFELEETYDAIVLDSILHFGKAGREKELALLDKAASHLNLKGFLFLFVHKSPKKEKELYNWFTTSGAELKLVEEGTINYVYEEKTTGFRSESQFYMLILTSARS